MKLVFVLSLKFPQNFLNRFNFLTDEEKPLLRDDPKPKVEPKLDKLHPKMRIALPPYPKKSNLGNFKLSPPLSPSASKHTNSNIDEDDSDDSDYENLPKKPREN